MKKFLKITAIAAGTLAAVEAGASAYLYRRTMKRSKADVGRTIKMSGTDWNMHMPLIQERKERMLAYPHEDVYQKSGDGLRLHAVYFPQDERKVVICFHGYTGDRKSVV